MNSVKSLKECTFANRPLEEKLLIKSLGRPKPHLNIEQESRGNDCTYTRRFRPILYEKYPWLCGCDVQNALYCFPCLLFGGNDIWTGIGIASLSHINALANKHMESKKHINSVLELSILGKCNSGSELNCEPNQEITKHNKQVDRNRYIASRMVDFLKTCKDLDLAMNSDGRPFSLEQILRNLETALKDCIQKSKLFQDFSKFVQEDLLHCILDVCHDVIIEEITRTKYVAVILDDTTAVSSSLYLLMILRYEVDGELHERFWGLVKIETDQSMDVFPCVLKELKSIFDTCPDKIIAVSFQGLSMTKNPPCSLESRIKENYPRAKFVLGYDLHLNTIVQNAASQNKSARMFFSCLPAFSAFFTCPQRMHLFDAFATKRGICAPVGGWDFEFQTTESVYRHREEILECCLELENSLCDKTVQEARILRHFLEDVEFFYWLNFFQKVMSQVENLDTEIQTGQVDIWKVLVDFNSGLYEIQNEVPENCETFFEGRKRLKINHLKNESQQVTEFIVSAVQYHLHSRDHVQVCKLLDPTCFPQYSKDFPDKLLDITVESYPDLNKSSLRPELEVIYGSVDFRQMEGVLLLLQFLYRCGLHEAFCETMNLVRIIVTLPVATPEIDRCPGTVERIKTLLKHCSTKEYSSTLIMLATEKKMVTGLKDFNKRVLEKLADRESWVTDFTYRK